MVLLVKCIVAVFPFSCIFPVSAKPIFTYLFQTQPLIPLFARLGGLVLHLSLELVVGGCNASSADLRIEEAVPGSTFNVGASR